MRHPHSPTHFPRVISVSRRYPATLLTFLLLAACSLLPSCSSDTDAERAPDTYPDLSLYAGDRVRIKGGDKTTWTSSYPLVASAKGDSVIAGFVGETRFTSSRGSFDVRVSPRYRTFDEPLMKWGVSMAQIRTSMSGYRLLNSSATSLTYYGRGSVYGYVYLFENGTLYGSSMLVEYTYTDRLLTFLLERYVPTGHEEENMIYYFVDPTKKMLVILSPRVVGSTVLLIVGYTPYPSSSSSVSLATGVASPQPTHTLSRELAGRILHTLPVMPATAPCPAAAARLSTLTGRLDSIFTTRTAHGQPE